MQFGAGYGKSTLNYVCIISIIQLPKFHDHIWNHREKWIQISTNMPGIGSEIRLTIKMSEIRESKATFSQ